MNLVFHDRSDSPAPYGEAFLTIERSGTFAFSATLVKDYKLKEQTPVVLLEDKDTSTWYITFSEPKGSDPFRLRLRDKRSTAMLFGSVPQARAFYEAHGYDRQTTPSLRLRLGKSIKHEGATLYPLTISTVPPVRPVIDFTARPDEAVMYRLNELVTQLGSAKLVKKTSQELTRAYGYLSKYPDALATIAGGTDLLNKLKALVG